MRSSAVAGLAMTGVMGFVLAAMTGPGCSSSSSSSSDGAGGTGGSGGSSGAGGGSTTTCLPPCLADLFKACTPSGSCTQQLSNMVQSVCYANNVKFCTDATGQATGKPIVTTVTKADGKSTCFTIEIVDVGNGATLTIKDASGSVVATGAGMPSDASAGYLESITCKSDGKTYTVDSNQCPGYGNGDVDGGTCATGTCSCM